jgi:hypothetical protein
MTPNSSDPNRVRVAGSFCRKFLISWSTEMPLDQPAGAFEPPWMLPGNSSVPVSRQPIPRMCPSPSPRIRSDSRSASASVLERRERLEDLLQFEVAPSCAGQKFFRTTPFGAEHEDDPLLPPLLVGEREAGRSARTAGRRR